MMPPHKTNTDHERDCENCDDHIWFVELVTAIRNDLSWIKKIGYVLLAMAGTFIVSVWSVGYPHLISLNEHMRRLESSTIIHAEKLSQLERTTDESKIDRREIRKCLDELKEKK